MSKYISLDALFENPDWQGWHDLNEDFKNGMENVMEYAENLPAIELSPVAGDYISRKALLEYPIRREHYDKEHGDEHFINGVESVMEYAKTLDAAVVAPETKLPEMEPCPFCGGRARFIYTRDGDYMYFTSRKVECMLACTKCGAKMEEPGGFFTLVFGRDGAVRIEGDGREKLINAWNRRAKNEEGRKGR